MGLLSALLFFVHIYVSKAKMAHYEDVSYILEQLDTA